MPLSSPALDTRRGPTINSISFLAAEARAAQVATAPLSAAWPLANDAYLMPFQIPYAMTFQRIFFMTGTTPGTTTFDLGVYNDQFALLRSLGSTAAVNNNDATMPVGGGAFPITLPRGRFFLAMSSAAITLTARASTYGNGWMRAVGMFRMANAHPLPATFVPVSMGATAFMPSVGLSPLTNVL